MHAATQSACGEECVRSHDIYSFMPIRPAKPRVTSAARGDLHSCLRNCSSFHLKLKKSPRSYFVNILEAITQI